MSLFTTLQMASNSLQAQQIGLQVVGQNIANVNTPGYTRSEANLHTGDTQRVGSLLLGLGVSVESITQKTDEHLNERLRSASSDRVGSEVQEGTYQQLESVLGELQDNDISSSMNNFLSAIAGILDAPQDASARNLAVTQGQSLTGDVNRLATRVTDIRNDLDRQIGDVVPDVNRLLQRIADLNVKITSIEGGSAGHSDAVGLRDERSAALTQLAQYMDIKTQEQTSGAVNVFVGGDYLVFEGQSRQIKSKTADSGTALGASKLYIAETDSPLQITSGKVAGLMDARDNIAGKMLSSLDNYAQTLAFEFNKAYSSGQGLRGFSQLTAERPVTAGDVPLDAAGLPYRPVNGGFDVLVRNTQTGITQTTHIAVDLNGIDDNDTTFNGLVTKLDAIDGISAHVDLSGHLVLESDSSNTEISFGNDNSGTLAALGINTFFTGTSAATIGVNAAVAADPTKFAASKSGIGGDTANAVELAAFLDKPLDTADGNSIDQVYSNLFNGVTQGSSVAQAAADGFRTFESTLQGQQLAVSGVNLDEEAVAMMSYQRAYQASARLIQTINQLLDTLVNL
jgi:flagellar hook-associated protein 1 FlgK